MQQQIPNKPDNLTSDEYALILERDQRRCVDYGKCKLSNGALACSAKLDFDHIQPVSLGGDDSAANRCLRCMKVNRGRAVQPDKAWTETDSYWDTDAITPGKLREVQQIAGWTAISELDRALTPKQRQNLRRTLLGTTTLLPGATGIGKTVLTASALLRFNQLVGKNYPRVRHALVLVTDNTLADAAVTEWRDDAVSCGFVGRVPVVHKANSFNALLRGPQKADIVVCTVQTIWGVIDKNKPDGVRHTDLEILRALLQFDTLIADECDWGTLSLKHISRLAKHMLQFSMTATPRVGALRDDTREFTKNFVMIAPGAVAGYQSAIELDQCLKWFAEPRMAAPHNEYWKLEKGQPKIHKLTMSPDHPLWCAAIMEAITEADQLETRMKKEAPNDWYSPHLMVRFDKIESVPLVYDEIRKKLTERRDLENHGWDVTMIFQGHTRHLDPELRDSERELFEKNGGLFVHPFMRAQNTRGQADEKCKRILLICNIGVRGMNNWPVTFIVDCTSSKRAFSSVADSIHFAYGRAIRWRERRNWLMDDRLKEFATARIFIPKSEDAADKLNQLNNARDFIVNMEREIAGAGFLSWLDLVEGRRPDEASVVRDPDDRPLTKIERWRVQHALTEATGIKAGIDNPPPVAAIAPTIERTFPGVSPGLHRRLTSYATSFATKTAFRKQEITGEPSPAVLAEAAAVQDRLEPQDTYELEDLRYYVHNSARYAPTMRARYQAGFDKPPDDDFHVSMVDAVSMHLRDAQTKNYSASPRLYHLHDDGGIFTELAAAIYRELDESGVRVLDGGKMQKAIISATKQLFAITNAKDDGPLDQPAYHIAIKGRYRDTIIARARGILVEMGALENKTLNVNKLGEALRDLKSRFG